MTSRSEETRCMVRLREAGARRHRGLGRDNLTDKWMHVLMFESMAEAEEAARWMLDNNRDSLDSAQVIDAHSRKVLLQFAP